MRIMTNLPIAFGVDNIGLFFAALTVIVFLAAGIYSFDYMSHSDHKKSYQVFFFAAMLVEVLACFASNMITYYFCFELLTVSSMPLVIQERTKESIMAALKYLIFSMFGAYSALFGIFFLSKYADTLDFVAGGSINAAVFAEHKTLLLWAAMALIIGFGVKAGMFPMHAWLPTAHPVAPAPASAVLSAVIVKAGVLGIVRSIYYVMGIKNVTGTWVQTAWIVLSLITVFMGSMLAYREPVLKKRLAYSTVSQVSYILFGLAIAKETSTMGSMLHVFGHGCIKAVLFLVAGAIIHYTGATKVKDMRGIGRKMPVTMWCYVIVSLGLIGIPPTGGFISKWYLAIGGLSSRIPVFSWLGPVVLLISALLTAGYLFELVVIGFFPGADFEFKKEDKCEPSLFMTVPIIILTVLSVVMGVLPSIFTDYISSFLGTLF